MITVQVEPFTEELKQELQSLLAVHWQMLALNKDKVPLRPDYDTYFALQASGRLSMTIMRASGKLIGYWVACIQPEPHYKTILGSKMDIFFIHPDYRHGSSAIILMRAVEREMRRRGVSRWWAGEKVHSPIGRLFKAFGFEPVDLLWSKWIGP